MNVKKKLAIVIVVLLLISSIFYNFAKPKEVVLTLGIFTGSYWDVPNEDSYAIFDDLIARFEKKYPNVKVEYVSGIPMDDYSNWLSRQALKGELPDVMLMLPNDFSTYAEVGLLENLEKYTINDMTFDKSSYYSAAYEAGLYKNRLFALPYESIPTLMFVNKTLLAKEYIEVPSSNWTWNDFYEICKKVSKDIDKDGKLDQFGVYGYAWEDAAYANDVQLFNEDGSNAYIDSSNMKEAIDFVRKIDRLNENINVSSSDFDEGKVAFCPMQFSQYRAYMPYPWRVKKFSTFEWDCIPLPKAVNGDNSSKIETLSAAMSADSKYKDEAWNLLKMISTDETTQMNIFYMSSGVSVLKDVTQSEKAMNRIMQDNPGNSDFKMDILNEVMEKGKSQPEFNNYFEAVEQLDVELYKIIKSTTSLDSALSKLQKKVNKILKES